MGARWSSKADARADAAVTSRRSADERNVPFGTASARVWGGDWFGNSSIFYRNEAETWLPELPNEIMLLVLEWLTGADFGPPGSYLN
jgi:hypothetical protein